MTRKESAMRSAQKAAYAALKADRRQAIGGLLAGEQIDIEITCFSVCDPDYGYDTSSRMVLIPAELAGDAAAIHALCDHDGYNHDVQITAVNGFELDMWNIVVTRHDMTVRITADIRDEFCDIARCSYWDKRFNAFAGWEVNSLADHCLWSADISAAVDSFKYYGCLLDNMYYKVAPDVGSDAAHNFVVGLYDLMYSLYGERAAWPKLQLIALDQLKSDVNRAYPVSKKSLESLETCGHSLIGYVHSLNISNGELTKEYPNFWALESAGYPATKSVALDILQDYRGTESQVVMLEESATYYRNQADWGVKVSSYPTTDLAWLYASGQFCEKNAMLPTEYNEARWDGAKMLPALAEGHVRKAKMTPVCSAFNPFITFAALGLAKHLPAGTLVTRAGVKDLHELNMLVVEGFVKVDKSLRISKHTDCNGEAVIAKIRMSHYLGAAADTLEEYRAIYLMRHIDWRSEHLYASAAAMPEKFKKQVASTEQLQTIIFEHMLEIDWTLGNSPKTAIVNTLVSRGVSKETAEQYLVTPDVQAALTFAVKTNNSHVVCELPEIVAENDKFVMEKLAKNDVRNLYIGELTSCCQKLGGAGHAVCVESWTDSKSANYVFRQGSTILGHMWVFKTACGGYMIDSIEGRSQISASVVTPMILDFVRAVGVPVYLSATSYGVTSQVARYADTVNVARGTVKSISEYSYMDYDGTNCVQVIA
jgi:hypothetical protein